MDGVGATGAGFAVIERHVDHVVNHKRATWPAHLSELVFFFLQKKKKIKNCSFIFFNFKNMSGTKLSPLTSHLFFSYNNKMKEKKVKVKK
jgi:hypothetical protein